MHEHKHIPAQVQSEIDAGVAALQEEIQVAEQIDPHYNRILETLENVSSLLEEQAKQEEGYRFDPEEFEAALPHIIADQLSALKKEKLSAIEWAERFNRWFVFSDTVINLGFSYLAPKKEIQKEDYEAVLRTLKLNEQFKNTFLVPHGIQIEMAYKSREIKEKYTWLAMPCLVIVDEEGQKHQIALTTSPLAKVWWLEVLMGFHASYQWTNESLMEQEDYEEAPYPGLGTSAVKDAGDRAGAS